jgi:hypothetical protein
MSRSLKLFACALASITLVAFALACGDSESSVEPYPETFELPTSAATPTTISPSPVGTDLSGPNEGGQAPIYWRTADNFASVVAGEKYLVNFRIANGYDESALSVTATCVSCRAGEQEELTFPGQNSPPFPAGSDLPGSYYPMNMVFPIAGQWEITVRAGADSVTIPVDVKAAT